MEMFRAMDYGVGKFWVDMIMLIWVIATALITWRVTRTRATTASIQRVDARVDAVQDEMTKGLGALRADIDRLECRVGALPDHEDIGKLYSRLATVEGQLNKLIGSVDALTRQFSTIHSYLLHNKER